MLDSLCQVRVRLPILLGFLTVLMLVGSIIVLVLAPAKIIGVSEETLSASLENEPGSGLGRQVCRKRDQVDGEVFTCAAEASGGNSRGFRVKVEDDGCWTARNRGAGAGRTAKRIEGCVSIGDYLRLSN